MWGGGRGAGGFKIELREWRGMSRKLYLNALSQLEFRSRNVECLINLNILAFSGVKFSSCDKADHLKLKGRVSKDL